MHKMQKALNWFRHAGTYLSVLSTRGAKERSSARLLDQARTLLGDGQLNTGLLRLQESVDALPGGPELFRGYENLGRFLAIIGKDQRFLAEASHDEKLYRHARAVDVVNRPNQDGTKPFRTLEYYRALEKTPLDIPALARNAFEAAAKLYSASMKKDSGQELVRLAGLLEGAGKTEQAIAAYKDAARLDPGFEEALREATVRLNYNTGK